MLKLGLNTRQGNIWRTLWKDCFLMSIDYLGKADLNISKMCLLTDWWTFRIMSTIGHSRDESRCKYRLFRLLFVGMLKAMAFFGGPCLFPFPPLSNCNKE